jgi:hypoxanthine-DNA glycosylase
MARLTGLPPVVNSATKILIVGTFPGVDSLAKQTYYASERNHLWDILFRCLDPEFPPYQPVRGFDRKYKYDFILSHNIGLWDIIESCEREGSNDSKIKDPWFHDLPAMLKNYKNVTYVIFNGSNAYTFFKSTNKTLPPSVKMNILNSTSTMNPNNSFHVLEEWLEWFKKHRAT